MPQSMSEGHVCVNLPYGFKSPWQEWYFGPGTISLKIPLLTHKWLALSELSIGSVMASTSSIPWCHSGRLAQRAWFFLSHSGPRSNISFTCPTQHSDPTTKHKKLPLSCLCWCLISCSSWGKWSEAL